jgi:hypothetical protein
MEISTISLRSGGCVAAGAVSAAIGKRGFDARCLLTTRIDNALLDASGLGESRNRFGFRICLIGRWVFVFEFARVESNSIVYNAKTTALGKATIT